MQVVALLHAINLGKTRRVAMQDLRASLERLELQDVRTHLQSGNALFTTSWTDGPALREALETELQSTFGFGIPVTLRTAEEWQDIMRGIPFNAEREEVRVAFLSCLPEPGAVAALQQKNFGAECWQIRGDHLYQTVPDGTKNLKLSQAVIERHLHCSLTVRHWRTMRAIHALLGK
ncbi:DUF1697 domain-containing protein [Deinococcus fonticola]|uniref:DUF1697 domain-containing protein n=1 Tax=Deinococcus fonticola TaxID=2528713 RepID=UPI0010757317|nr:DUF1697 domain-containing protein [Deinococcus fonticola]